MNLHHRLSYRFPFLLFAINPHLFRLFEKEFEKESRFSGPLIYYHGYLCPVQSLGGVR